MKTLMTLTLPWLCALLLGACQGKPPEPQAAPAAVASPLDGLRAQQQRARDVQKTVNRHADEQRRQIEAQEQ